MLLHPLTERPEHLDTYILVEELPKTDLSDYLALLRSCKEIHAEVKPHFEQQHLPKTMFCFTNVPALSRFHCKIRTLGPQFQNIQFLLRTEAVICEQSPCDKSNIKAFGQIQLDIERFTALQPGFQIDLHKFKRCRKTKGYCLDHKALPAISSAGKARAVEEDGIVSISTERYGKAIDVRKCPVARDGGELEASTRWVCGDGFTTYSQLKGLLKDVGWEGPRIFGKEFEGAVKEYSESPQIESEILYTSLLDDHLRKPLGLIRADDLVGADQDAEVQDGTEEDDDEENKWAEGEDSRGVRVQEKNIQQKTRAT
ncbi:hypothetical protein LTR37_020614 [Vermiconidia calcicola]|uniref:Uncharacterized protein n=1 Tax=Vermiconidia calcicola TaxID=1690605 RepID=A0ACC3MAV1_9PEZI|nr:hypothetical protein LTR37_020614 [Vermiconidia calcicola]